MKKRGGEGPRKELKKKIKINCCDWQRWVNLVERMVNGFEYKDKNRNCGMWDMGVRRDPYNE
jgi:hypothetical protein